MSRLALVPFRAEHALGLIDRDTLTCMEISQAVERETQGPAYSALLDDKVIVCSGVMVMWPGVGYAWAAMTDDVGPHGLWVTRVVKRTLQDICRSLSLHRVESVALADDARAQRWLWALGFELENTEPVKKFTSDQRDVLRFEYLP